MGKPAAESGFETANGDAVAFAECRATGSRRSAPRCRGLCPAGGVGRKPVRGTLDAVRATGRKVVPRRRFLAAHIERHSEHRDPLAHEG